MRKMKPIVKPPIFNFKLPKPSFDLSMDELEEHLKRLDKLRQEKEKLKNKINSLLPWWEQT